MAVQDYKELKVWQKSVDLAIKLYEIVKDLPSDERYAISDQMRRAVVSIASNIAEGQQRYNSKEFKHFLKISLGSLAELETQLIICQKTNMIDDLTIENMLKECNVVTKMIFALMKSLPTNKKHK